MSRSTTVPFSQIKPGGLFHRNGMLWKREDFPSGHNARYMEADGLYHSIKLEPFQEVRPLNKEHCW